jgi:hypothetical protein
MVGGAVLRAVEWGAFGVQLLRWWDARAAPLARLPVPPPPTVTPRLPIYVPVTTKAHYTDPSWTLLLTGLVSCAPARNFYGSWDFYIYACPCWGTGLPCELPARKTGHNPPRGGPVRIDGC